MNTPPVPVCFRGRTNRAVIEARIASEAWIRAYFRAQCRGLEP
jgi:hypothetical protein